MCGGRTDAAGLPRSRAADCGADRRQRPPGVVRSLRRVARRSPRHWIDAVGPRARTRGAVERRSGGLQRRRGEQDEGRAGRLADGAPARHVRRHPPGLRRLRRGNGDRRVRHDHARHDALRDQRAARFSGGDRQPRRDAARVRAGRRSHRRLRLPCPLGGPVPARERVGRTGVGVRARQRRDAPERPPGESGSAPRRPARRGGTGA